MKKDYIERLKSIKEKRMQLEVVSLEKKMKAKLERKIKEKDILQ